MVTEGAATEHCPFTQTALVPSQYDLPSGHRLHLPHVTVRLLKNFCSCARVLRFMTTRQVGLHAGQEKQGEYAKTQSL
jgi:hypothetical protein